MTEGIIGKSSEATKGGFRAIIEIEGDLCPVKRVPPPPEFTGWGNKPPSDQAEITLESAIIRKMEEGEPEPELQDDRFRTWMTYAGQGKPKPNANSFFAKYFVTSAQELDSKRRGVKLEDGDLHNIEGTRVILRRESKFIFKKRKEGTDPENPEYDEVYQENYVVVVDEEAGDDVNMDDHITGLVVGNVSSVAKRNLLMDARAKQHPEYKKALDDGSLAELLGLEVVDGKFTQKEE